MGTLHANLTLRRLTAIAISKHLWMHSELRDCLKFCSGWVHGHDFHDAGFKKMCAPVVKRVVDNFLIPEPAKEELLFAVQIMGSQMLWTWVVEQKSFSGIKGSAWLEYISWRADGFPNMSEMVRSLYSAGLFESNYFAWDALSACCLEDCINDLWPKMGSIDKYRDWRTHKSWSAGAPRRFFSDYWIARMENNPQVLRDAMQQSAHYRGNFHHDEYSIEENMFIISVVDAQYWAAQYFFEKLNENQRMRMIAKSCGLIKSNYYHFRLDVGSLLLPTIGRYHLLMFLVQQLSYYGLDEIRIKLLKTGSILRLMLHWPYDDLFIDTLREMSIHHDFNNYYFVLYEIFEAITGLNMYLFIDRDVKYHRIFYRIWNANLPNFKSSIDSKVESCLVTRLWQREDIDLLNFILRDEQFKDRREKLLKKLIEMGYEDGVNPLYYSNFISKVLISEEEREWFAVLAE